MHCLVFGAGAVGGYLGAKLIQAGWHVTFHGRQQTVQSWTQEGLRLIESDASHHIKDIEASHHWPPEGLFQPNLILLTVKAFDCQQAAEQIKLAGWHAPVFSFINGVGSETSLTEILPDSFPVHTGTLTTAVERLSLSEIKVAKERGVGLSLANGICQELADAFIAASMKVDRYSNSASMKWSKLLSNLIGSATAALTGLTVAEIYSHPGLFRLELAALREAHRVMIAANHNPVNLPGVPIGALTRILFLPSQLLQPILKRAVATGRGGKRPSMYYDVNRGKTEVMWLHGAVARQGRKLGLATPANQLLSEQVSKLEAGMRMPVSALLALAGSNSVPGVAGYNRPG